MTAYPIACPIGRPVALGTWARLPSSSQIRRRNSPTTHVLSTVVHTFPDGLATPDAHHLHHDQSA